MPSSRANAAARAAPPALRPALLFALPALGVLALSAALASMATPELAEMTRVRTVAALPPASHVAPPVGEDPREAMFRADLRAFESDVLATERVDEPRAREIAYHAVSAAYRHAVPPSLVFGVMLIENPQFVSEARSFMGATGLMQIMPNYWLEPLGPTYGHDLEDDAVNIPMGVHILAHYFELTDGDWRRALLRYNGCVRGTNTPNCHSYPDIVRTHVERRAQATCAPRSFERCVGLPVYRAFSKRS